VRRLAAQVMPEAISTPGRYNSADVATRHRRVQRWARHRRGVPVPIWINPRDHDLWSRAHAVGSETVSFSQRQECVEHRRLPGLLLQSAAAADDTGGA
jgi:hypothetical protein